MTRFDAILLDLDATLVDERYVEIASVAACGEYVARHPGLDPMQLARANFGVWMAYWPEIEDVWVLGELGTNALRLQVWRRTLAQFDESDEALIAEIADIHHRHEQANYGAFGDAVPTIDALRAAGVKVGVLTNGATDTQREKLDILRITERVDAIIVSGEHAAAKPDPALFETALRMLGSTADRTAHVGDSLLADVGGALASGVTAIWLNRTGAVRGADDPVPDLEIGSLDVLVALASGGRDGGAVL
jgi:HAD superfamily hydrolase (TIGR01549 family)